jgi:hypothetical protein
MAKQVGPIKFRGKLDDVCGRLTKDGAILQTKTGPRREQVLHNDNFINTRRNASEFGGAVDASTLLRKVLGYTVKAVKHEKLVCYMNKKLHAVMKSDKQSGWGDRGADKGDLQLLKGFDYNQELALSVALPRKLSHALDMATGQVMLAVPGGLVRHKKAFPEDATHFRIVSCAGAVDFNKNSCSYDIAESALLPLSKVMPALQLKHQLVGKPGEVMLHTAGMVFYEVVDGEARLLRGGVLRVLEVERVAEVVEQDLSAASPSGDTTGKIRETLAIVEEIGTSTQNSQSPVCASVCVTEAMPVLQVVRARNMACATCVLEEEMVGAFGFRLVEEDVDCGLVEELAGDGGEVGAVVETELEDFALGMVDAKGVVLQGKVIDNCREVMPKRTNRNMKLSDPCQQ